MKTFEEEVRLAAEALKNGKVILYPTDTIWGLGCDATNQGAVARLFKVKKRTDNKSLIALIDDIERLKDYVKIIPPIAYDLIENAANPISVVFPGGKNLAKNVPGKDGTICIRITKNEFCKAVVKALNKPIASTSANISGDPTPLFFSQITDKLKNSVDHVVGLFQDEIKLPKASTIIKIELNGQFTILRP
ncbi:MAG: threonylcarbamoyl-AMP synthase [Bacteroidetes bacterium HGW-Bacteroidetes-1]|jgi:L-threonylcarbamoyladenylate synthase|nr:MAG: threonylcarbamoyl-AMP synthase [Bacteroidetes bacterium HGW-Bacteroidetes-1]